MLEGIKIVLVSLAELTLYIAICFIAYHRPETVRSFPAELDLMMDNMIAFVVVSIFLGICTYFHLRIFEEQRKKLDKQNEELEKANDALNGINKMKTEFLQDIQHEIRNPLYVISLGTDFIHNSIETQGGAEETHKALNNIQNEAMRLGRMINGMVDLAIMSENQKSREKTDFAALLKKCAEASRLQAEQKRNTLRVEIAPDLPFVYAEPEQLQRVPINLLSNAINAAQDGEITVEAFAGDGYITVRVRDTGEGITRSLLPRVFERGVSGKGGKGYGLPMCKTIVEAHGGMIEIESEPGAGTAATFTIPVYGGQDERGEEG
jgi:signal transduction histidine kinase